MSRVRSLVPRPLLLCFQFPMVFGCTPCRRPSSVADVPASSSLRIETILASVKRLFFTRVLLGPRPGTHSSNWCRIAPSDQGLDSSTEKNRPSCYTGPTSGDRDRGGPSTARTLCASLRMTGGGLEGRCLTILANFTIANGKHNIFHHLGGAPGSLASQLTTATSRAMR